jgi:acyl-CoA reductase-like NAD-dependent aldehyde dehydrogenase
MEPTIFDVAPTMSIAREEIFGPVLSASAPTPRTTLALASDNEFGLGSAV